MSDSEAFCFEFRAFSGPRRERVYGALLDGAQADLAARLDRFDAAAQ